MKTYLSAILLSTLAACAPLTAFADTDIVVDFGCNDGARQSSGYVNNVTPTGTNSDAYGAALNYTTGSLTDYTTHAASGVTINLNSGSWYFRANSGNGDYTTWGGSTSVWMTHALADDYLIIGSPYSGYSGGSHATDGSYLTATINGLNVGGSYKLQLLSGADDTDDYGSGITCNITANGNYASSEFGSATKTYGNHWDATAEGGKNYLVWDSLTADSNGKITISLADITGDGNSNLFLNGLRLTSNPIPEPSETAAAVGILALAGAFLWRKKKAAR